VAQEGQEIAGYKLLRKIGQGGMGEVFLAEQIRLRRQVAIKLVHLDVKPDMPPSGAEPAEELTREAEALMALEHPHILPLYDTGRDGDTAYLVMPYIPEGSLQDALRPGPRQQLQLPLPPGEALIYLEQAAAALQYAHDRNFIHRDVKPANFLIRSLTRSNPGSGRSTKRLHLFLADFGLSKFLAYSTNTTHLSGTPTYMAPEQFQGRAGPASDQYSLAILFYYLLTGDLPYRGSPVELMFHHLNDAPPSPAALVKDIPESLARVIQRGMAKTPEDRYPSVASMAEAAREALVEAGMVPAQDSMPVPAVRPADLQQEQPTVGKPDPHLAATVAVETSVTPPAGTDDQATARGQVGGTPAAPAKPAESSLPTLPIESPKRPGKRPSGDEQSSQRRPRRLGWIIGLAAAAVIIALGAVFGSRLLLQSGQHPTSTPVTQVTQPPTGGPTATTGTTPTTQASPTPEPQSLLSNILAQRPYYSVDMSQGGGPWDGPHWYKPPASYHMYTPGDRVDLLNASATLTARTFQPPLAIAVDLTASGDQEFDILLATRAASGAHLYYRLQITNNAPPQAAHSTDNKTFIVDGTGTTVNASWASGGKHTLILVLDGPRLLFYIDGQPLLDTQIPQPLPTATLTLASLNEASITAIRFYNVPQAG
jgi:serine/threonine protein kinase